MRSAHLPSESRIIDRNPALLCDSAYTIEIYWDNIWVIKNESSRNRGRENASDFLRRNANRESTVCERVNAHEITPNITSGNERKFSLIVNIRELYLTVCIIP